MGWLFCFFHFYLLLYAPTLLISFTADLSGVREPIAITDVGPARYCADVFAAH